MEIKLPRDLETTLHDLAARQQKEPRLLAVEWLVMVKDLAVRQQQEREHPQPGNPEFEAMKNSLEFNVKTTRTMLASNFARLKIPEERRLYLDLVTQKIELLRRLLWLN